MKKASVLIQNLKCGGCAHTINTKLEDINGISNVIVNVETSTVHFNYLSKEELMIAKNKLNSLGYPIEGNSNSIATKTKSYISCATGKLAKNQS